MANEITENIRKKYQNSRFEALTDSEKFQLLLSYSEKDKNIEEAAAKLCEIYGTPRMAMDSDPRFLVKDCGISMQSALLLTMIPWLKRTCELEKCRENPLNTVENAKKYFSAYVGAERVEILVATAVTKNFKILESKILSKGTVSGVSAPSRETVDFALRCGTPYIFISHNHPMGVGKPSPADISATKSLIHSLKLINVTVVDHIIVGCGGKDDIFSMRAQLERDVFDDVAGYKIMGNC